MRLQLIDLVPQHVGCVVDATQNAQASGVGHGSGEFGARSNVHTGQKDRVLDLEKISGRRADLL
jgi:hypothetical protein